MPDCGAAAFRWFTRSRWPGRSGGGRAAPIAAGQPARDPDIATLAITVGLSGEYDLARRLHG